MKFNPRYPLVLLYSLEVVGFPLFSGATSMLGIAGTPASIAYRMLFLALAGSVMAGWLYRRIRIYAGLSVMCMLLLLWMLLARLSWDWLFPSGGLEIDFVRYSLFFIGTCVIPALAFLEIPSDRTLRLARAYIELVGALAALSVVYLFVTDGSETPTRLSTAILNPISVGHLGVSLFIASVATMQDRASLRRGLVRASVLRPLIALGALVVVLASGSRGPVLCALVVAGFMAFVPVVGSGQFRLKGVVPMLTVAAFAGIAIGLTTYLEGEKFGAASRLLWQFDETRIQLTAGALSQFMANPILGDGLVESESGFYPHNIFVESLMATGLAGFVLLSITVACCLSAAWTAIRASHATRWVGLLYVQYLIAVMFSGSLYLDGQFWTLSAAVLAIAGATQHARAAAARGPSMAQA